MKAVGLHRYLPIDHPESLLDLEVDTPVAKGRDLLLDVRAVSVNPVDTKRRAGTPATRDKTEDPARILGWDGAGVVKACGPEARLFKPGDEVYWAGSVIRQGSNSQFQLVDERIVGRKPKSLDFAHAAALPLTTLTAWELMFDRMGIAKSLDRAGARDAGKRVLILAGAGGVGSIAIQVAKTLAHLHVIATASRPESAAWAKAMGADEVVDHRDLKVDEVDYLLIFASTDLYWPMIPKLVKPQGKVGLIVRPTKPVDLTLLHDKSITACLEGMFTRSIYQTPDMQAQHALLTEAAGLVDAGVLQSTFKENLGRINAENLKAAHRRLEAGREVGKLVLEGW